ncbi:MAG: hypothetical protein N5P05_000564 [Chroococcopsis gigantea SAG 12.99]|jgi:PAS domain S-box-containing protein|nr:PAS domain S-box protein [Chlorogloea purpurea SAG 13.99]MDV2998958.1 hypothetical protein [Chroococcopsis gigantea SAG 12.99]
MVLEDANGIIQACNLDAQFILGLRREQILGNKSSFLWYDAIDPHGSPVTLTGGENKTIGIPRENDEFLWLEVDVQFLFGVDGDHPPNVIYNFRTLDSKENNLLEELQTEIEQQKTEVISCNSETKFKTIFESEMIPMGIWTKAGAILEANKALLNLLGYSEEELARGEIHWVAMTPPEYQELDRKALEEIATKGYSTPFEKVYIHKDGHPIPILVGGAAFTDDCDSGVFFVLDLTSRQQTQQALKLSEAKFSRLVDANIFGVAIGDYAGRMLYANEALLNMIGYSREELDRGEIYWVDLTPPEYLPLDWAAGEELLEKGVCAPFEKEYFHKDGHRVPILIGSALLDSIGEGSQQVITFYMDLTKLKRAESVYRETAESLSLSLQAAHMGYWHWDKKTDTVSFSKRGSEIFDVVEDQPITWTEIQTRIHHEDLHLTREAVSRALELGEDYDIEYRLRLFNGDERWVSAKGRAQYDSSGSVIGMVGVA